MKDVKTLTGLTLAEAQAKLDAVLPPEAYSAVPGGADLTDIDPNYMRSVLNDVFGLCGFGWGYEYAPADMETHSETRKTQNGGTREVVVATLKHLRFWYKLHLAADGNGRGETLICSVDASGGSENSNIAYAMKGAITNALGNAVSNIGFQESVYLGKRSHKTVRAEQAAKPAAKPAVRRPQTAERRAQTTDDIEELDAAPAPADPSGYVIPLGKRKGQKLGDQPLEIIQWYAEQMAAGDDPARRALQEAARAFLKVKANGRVQESAFF